MHPLSSPGSKARCGPGVLGVDKLCGQAGRGGAWGAGGAGRGALVLPTAAPHTHSPLTPRQAEAPLGLSPIRVGTAPAPH